MNEIKTFEDACKALGLDPTKLPDFSMMPEKHQNALLAHAKLVLIAEALNGDWKPDWNNDDEYKYFPWFDMEKSESNEDGFVLYNVYYDFTFTDVSSRLCFKSRDIANYAGTQFKDLYKDYMLVV